MWFFVEEDISGSLKNFQQWAKEAGLTDTTVIKGGCIDNQFVDTAQVSQIAKIPPKIELIASIAGGIKGVTTKLARVIKEPNSKLARAIKLAGEKQEE